MSQLHSAHLRSTRKDLGQCPHVVWVANFPDQVISSVKLRDNDTAPGAAAPLMVSATSSQRRRQFTTFHKFNAQRILTLENFVKLVWQYVSITPETSLSRTTAHHGQRIASGSSP